MKEMTFEDLLAVAPLTDETKKEFGEKYPSFSSEKQMEVLHILWRGYRVMKRFLKQQLYDSYGEKIASGEFTPPADYEAFIINELETMISKKKMIHEESQEIQDIRSKLATYISSPDA